MKKSDTEYDKVDYHKFADSVGYEMPQKSNKEEIRKQFYKILLKNTQNLQMLE
jgi:hypothetical protein